MISQGARAGLRRLIDDLRPSRRWRAPQGYRDVLAMCLPLIASTTVSSLMLFTDRLFLSRHSVNAIAASLPAGVAWICFLSFFLGVATYSGVFVAQYTGANKPERAAAALWQGLYFSLAAGLALSCLYFASPLIFSLGAEDPEIVALEIDYFGPLILFSPINLAMAVMSSFLAALGRTKSVMLVSLLGAAFNIPLNYLLIFGLEWGGEPLIPSLGVFGAALATILSWFLSVGVYAALIFNRRMAASHGILRNRRLDWPLLRRMTRFGWPGGLQFFMEIFAFAFFNFAVARLDPLQLASNNIVFSIEALSFFPMIGVGQTISILVGQAIGRGAPVDGARATVSGMVISSLYVLMMFLCFLLFPKPLLSLFLADGLDPAQRAFILDLGTVLLRYVACYSVFDGIYLCCFGAIKGSGDVWFPMLAMAFWGIAGLVAPIMVLFAVGAATIESMWVCMVLYIVCLTVTGAWRYRSGKWMRMRVIEPALDLR
jgi:MATE family multidrug resistance protein